MEKLDFRYQMPEGQTLTYRTKDDFTQSVEVMGQKVVTVMEKDYTYSVVSKGKTDNSFDLGFTIDSIKMEISSTAAGNMTPDLGDIAGKTFAMKLNSLGIELEVIGAEDLKYELGQQGTQSLTSDFQSVFPDFPGRHITIGDSWTTVDTIKVMEGGVNSEIVITGDNTLAGFERINKHDCAVIEVDYIGVFTSKGEQQGMEFITIGNMKGKETWYFDHINGIFVKMVTKGNGSGNITASGPQEMIIPLMQKVEIETMLVE